MIAQLTGIVQKIRLDSAILTVHGVGYLVYATPATLATLREGQDATLWTSLVVREDSMTLFGFTDFDERDVFETVQTVSGVGPRLALAMLAIHPAQALRTAVVHADIKALTKVPGIGPKVAQRIVLELSNRMAPPQSETTQTPTTPTEDDASGQVIDALMSLGWNTKQAENAVDQVRADTGQPIITPAQVPATLRAALKILGGPRA